MAGVGRQWLWGDMNLGHVLGSVCDMLSVLGRHKAAGPGSWLEAWADVSRQGAL